MIRLQNLDRRPFSFNLYHSETCVKSGVCTCTAIEVHLPGGHRGSRLDPEYVRIGGFGTREGNLSEELPESVIALGPVATRLHAVPPTLRVCGVGGSIPLEVVVAESEPEPEPE